MTDFEVGYANGVLSSYAGEAARYEINPQSGVLTVFDGDGFVEEKRHARFGRLVTRMA